MDVGLPQHIMTSTNGQRRETGWPGDVLRVAAELREAASGGVDKLKEWLASPSGKQFRKRFATAVVFSAPLILRSPLFRASLLGRIVALAGGAGVLIKLAEALRDWEPEGPPAATV